MHAAEVAAPFQSNRIYLRCGKVKSHHPFFSLSFSHSLSRLVTQTTRFLTNRNAPTSRVGKSTGTHSLRFAKQSKNKMVNRTHNGTIVGHKWAFYWCSVARAGHSGNLTHHTGGTSAFRVDLDSVLFVCVSVGGCQCRYMYFIMLFVVERTRKRNITQIAFSHFE